MKIIRINHLGIVSKNPTACTNFFQNILGLQNSGNETISEQKVTVDMFAVENSNLEILNPTDEDSPIYKYLCIKGSGIHHIALEVDDIEEWIAELERKSIKMIDTTPRIGAHHTKIAFIHPHATGGILVELVQPMH